MAPPTPLGGLIALRVASLSTGVLMTAMSWAHARMLQAAYGVICGSGNGHLAHCPACYAALAAFGVGALTLFPALPRSLVRGVFP